MLNMSVTVEGERDLDLFWANRVIPTLADGCKDGVRDGMKEGLALEKDRHPYQDRSGRLSNDTKADLQTVTVNGAAGEMVWLAPYSRFVEFGTAAHVIEAKDGGALHFMWKGVEVFFKRVHHPGGKPYPFAGVAIFKAQAVAVMNIELAVDRAARLLWGQA